MHFKKLLSLIMAFSMLFSLSPLAYADYSSPVTVTLPQVLHGVRQQSTKHCLFSTPKWGATAIN